jgi:outer membrane porin, OprD family
MNKPRGRRRTSVRIDALLAAGLASSFAVSAQTIDLSDPFLKDAVAGFNARTFYMNVEDNSNPPATTQKEAWALGGKLFGRTGYWDKTVQFGASYYVSLPLYAPEDKDGTALLAPGQDTISVLGELFVRLKYESNTLTLGRQEIDMAYKRPSGVRSNRSDVTWVGKLDNRMVPVTYQAALFSGQSAFAAESALNYYLGWINRAKPKNSNDFVSVGSAIGAPNSDSDMWMGGLQYAPMKDFWMQGAYYVSPDVIRIGYLDTDYVLRLAEKSYFRLAGQYTDQRSDGSNALTGQPFSTSNAQAYAEFGNDWVTLYGAYSRTGSGADIRLPFASGPIYTQQVTRTFVRAHERAWQLGIGSDFGSWVSGLSGWVDVTSGTGAINSTTGANLANEIEYDLGTVYALKLKGSLFDGLRARFRYAWVTDQTSVGDQHSTDLRIDVNLPINFF